MASTPAREVVIPAGGGDQIEPSELQYHTEVIAQMQGAQSAWQSWLAHLARKYNLGPNDGISSQGVILRNARPSAEEQGAATA